MEFTMVNRTQERHIQKINHRKVNVDWQKFIKLLLMLLTEMKHYNRFIVVDHDFCCRPKWPFGHSGRHSDVRICRRRPQETAAKELWTLGNRKPWELHDPWAVQLSAAGNQTFFEFMTWSKTTSVLVISIELTAVGSLVIGVWSGSESEPAASLRTTELRVVT